jgi:hypothetical protein
MLGGNKITSDDTDKGRMRTDRDGPEKQKLERQRVSLMGLLPLACNALGIGGDEVEGFVAIRGAEQHGDVGSRV